MEILAAAILGILQGLTEFLPISSSAHLILVPWFLGWELEGRLIFDVSLHVGTALAVLTYFWPDWIRIGREVIRGLAEGRPLGNLDRKLGWYLAVGTVPAMMAGLLFEEMVENQWRSPLIAAAMLVLFGAALFIAERRSRQNRSEADFTWADSIFIGLSQAVALIPGVSRSGVTITAGLLRNCERKTAARFSFLLSTPVIVGAGLLEFLRMFGVISSSAETARNPLPLVASDWILIAVGMLFAAVTGFLCIRFFLRYLENRSFLPFVIYRFILAGIILIYYFKY